MGRVTEGEGGVRDGDVPLRRPGQALPHSAYTRSQRGSSPELRYRPSKGDPSHHPPSPHVALCTGVDGSGPSLCALVPVRCSQLRLQISEARRELIPRYTPTVGGGRGIRSPPVLLSSMVWYGT